MTSQKRYRHHHDNNAASRFRDLPPRFKRQKSSTSPKPTPVESNLMNQENEICSSPSPSNSPPLSQNTNLTCNTSLDTPMKQPFRIFNSQSPPPSLLQGQVPKDAPLSVNTAGFVDYSFPMSEVYNNNQYLQPHNYLTPPLSPWNGQCNAMKILPGSEVAAYPQNPRTSPDVVYPDILAPALEMATASPESPWARHSPILHQDRLSTASPMHPEVLSKPSQMHTVREKPVDYSDPDIRTIEMLRELERVADQKEKEDEADAGTDRKNLVSHHLRMLMCAVDRYTADIDEETPSADESNDSSFATTQCAGNELSSQWQKQGKKQRGSNSHSQNKREQPQDRKFSNQVIRDNTKMSNVGSNKVQMNSAPQQWANVPQSNSNSIYNSSWQVTKPPQSQSPPNLISSHAASVQMKSQAPLPHSKSMPTLNKPSPAQVMQTPQASHFNTSPPINQPCFVAAPMAGYPYQAHSGHQTPQDAFAHLWSSQAFDASNVSEYQRKGWDIWSGPSFVNIYSQELCNQGSRNATELEQDFLFYVNGSTSDRKPLYKR